MTSGPAKAVATGGAALMAQVRAALAAAGDPAAAQAMQRYMKSAMPYHGVKMPAVRALARALFADLALPDAAAWQALVLHLWRQARFREERYAALMLAGHRRALPFQTLDALGMYEEMIVTGAWWDLVDEIATHALGLLLRRHRAQMKRRMLAWSRHHDMWKRRSSIICQMKAKADTDLELLYACIEPSLASEEFFLSKAIGWALRQYAWTDPAEVARYVTANRARLSPLSRREALKNAGRRRRGRREA
jgi:3-methyladenine DNA glycosylase AlkD